MKIVFNFVFCLFNRLKSTIRSENFEIFRGERISYEISDKRIRLALSFRVLSTTRVPLSIWVGGFLAGILRYII